MAYFFESPVALWAEWLVVAMNRRAQGRSEGDIPTRKTDETAYALCHLYFTFVHRFDNYLPAWKERRLFEYNLKYKKKGRDVHN